MPCLTISVSDDALERLRWFAQHRDEQARTVDQLASDAVEDAAIRVDIRCWESWASCPNAKSSLNGCAQVMRCGRTGLHPDECVK